MVIVQSVCWPCIDSILFIFYHIGEKVDPQDFFKTSAAVSKSGKFPLGGGLTSSSASPRTQSCLDSRTKFQKDSSSENLDPSQSNTLGPLPLTTSTVSKAPQSIWVTNNSHSSFEFDIPSHHNKQVSTNSNRPEGRSRVGKNLLGIAATNSPITPR